MSTFLSPLTEYFARPWWLLLLLAAPVVIAINFVNARRRNRDWAAIGVPGRLRNGSTWLWVGAEALLVVALAGPRLPDWLRAGNALGGDMVLLIDTSRSMAAEDCTPDRLGSAIAFASGLVRTLGREPGTRIAVVDFAGRAVVRCPLTENLGAVIDALAALQAGRIEPGGTNLGMALETALGVFSPDAGSHAARAIVLFSDGEDHADSWRRVVGRLAEAGIVVHSVALGDDARGHEIPLVDASGARPMKYHGELVLSRRDDRALRRISTDTGGAFVAAGTSVLDLGDLYTKRVAPTVHFQQRSRRADSRDDRYRIPTTLALGLIIGACWPPRRGIRLLGLLFLLAVSPGAGPDVAAAKREIARSNAAYAAGAFERALQECRAAAAFAPNLAVPRYNAGAALFQLGRFEEAGAEYRAAAKLADARLRIKIDYALGNVAAALGQLEEAVGHYDDCIGSELSDSALEKIREDARINRQFVARILNPPPPVTPDDAGNRRTKSNADSDSDQAKNQGERKKSDAPAEKGAGESASTDGRSNQNPGAASSAGSPEERLAAALGDVRDSLRNRPADQPREHVATDDRDW